MHEFLLTCPSDPNILLQRDESKSNKAFLDSFSNFFGLIKVSHQLSHICMRQNQNLGRIFKDFIHEELNTRNEGIRLVKFLTNSQIANSWSCLNKIDFPSICGGEICYLTFLECLRMKIFDHISLLLQGSKFLLHFYDLGCLFVTLNVSKTYTV